VLPARLLRSARSHGPRKFSAGFNEVLVLGLPMPRRYQSFRERLIRGESDPHRQLAAELEQLIRVAPYG